MQSGMFDEVHGERSLSHTGTGGENDEVGGLKSVRHLIQPFEPRLYALEGVGVRLNGLELLQHLLNDIPFAHAREGRAIRLFGNIVYRFFRKGNGVAAVRARHAVFDDFARGADELSVGAVPTDDFVIRLVICRRGSNLRQFGEIGDSSRLFEIALPVELVGQSDEVDGLAVVENHLHGVNDKFMRFLIKVVLGKFFHQFRRDIVVDEETSQQRHFRIAVIGHGIDFCCHFFIPVSP